MYQFARIVQKGVLGKKWTTQEIVLRCQESKDMKSEEL